VCGSGTDGAAGRRATNGHAILGAMHHQGTLHDADSYAPFTARAMKVLRAIPRGKVATYGLVAAAAGSPLAARQVVRVLHTLSDKERLPWHRVIGSDGSISLRPGAGLEEQTARLKAEGVGVSEDGRVNMKKHLWKPRLD
jgi:methylated-DNA-protein-cysteine methyltransferase related protein